MSLLEQWKELAEKERPQKEYEEFWAAYFEKEKNNYEKILENKETVIRGTISGLSKEYSMDLLEFTGFIDGINTSLREEVALETLAEDCEVTLDIDFEKLYFNMLKAKADWLFNIPQWEDVLDEEKRTEITKEFRRSQIAVSNKVGRNEPCTCGSGKKYKKCCGMNK